MRSVVAGTLTVLLVTATVVPAAAVPARQNDAEAYAGTHVSFVAESDAVTNYTVGGEELLASVQTESRSSYRDRRGLSLGVDLDLSTVTELRAAGLSVAARSQTNATVESESGATLAAHDNPNGVLVVRAGGERGQMVRADVAAGAETSAEGDGRVVVTSDGGESGTFVVVGDGEVAVNEEGDVVAELEEDASLVFRSYVGRERDEDDEAQEQLIADGEAAGEVYVMHQDGERVTDTVTYARDTSIEAGQSAENEVAVTVQRSAHEGRVVIAHVSEAAIGSTEDVQVTVDGEAAARASSYAELRSAAAGGERSMYMVRQDGSAEGSVQVLVGVNHFSERTITMSGGDGGTDGGSDGGSSDGGDGATDADAGDGSDGADGSDGGAGSDGGDGPSSVGSPGFGVIVALVGLAAAAMARRRH